MARPVDHDEQRQALLAQAFPVFVAQGVAALSMRRLARELGVTTGTLYHYFEGKQQLLEQLAQQIADVNVAALRVSLQNVGTPTERLAQLEDFFSTHRDLLSNGLVLLLEFQRGFEAPGTRAARDVLATYQQAVDELFPELDAAQGALLFNAILGWLIRGVTDPKDQDLGPMLAAIKPLVP